MKIQTSVFLSKLEKLKPGTSKTPVLRQSDCVAFLNGCMFVFNDETAVCISFDSEIEGAVNFQMLYNTVKKMPDTELLIEQDENAIKIQYSETGICELCYESDIHLPIAEFQETLPENKLELSAEMIEKTQTVARYCSKNTAGGEHTCLGYVYAMGDAVEACDNERFMRFFLNDPIPDGVHFLMPQKTAKLLSTWGAEHYAIGDKWLHLFAEDAQMSVRTMDIKYPDMDSILVDAGVDIIMPMELIQILERARLFGQQGNADNEVEMYFNSGELTVTCHNSFGRFRDQITVECDTDMKFNINADYLKDFMKKTKGKAMVNITEANGPDIIEFDAEDSVSVIMLSE